MDEEARLRIQDALEAASTLRRLIWSSNWSNLFHLRPRGNVRLMAYITKRLYATLSPEERRQFLLRWRVRRLAPW